MIWGEQWLCGCGWSNFHLREKCRNCGLPRDLKVRNQSLDEVMRARGEG